MLALVKDNQIIRTLDAGNWVHLSDNRQVSPAIAGWKSEDGYALVEIEEADAVPADKIASATEVAMVDGRPKWVHVLIDKPLRFPNADAAKEALTAWATKAAASITGPVPPDEKIAWPTKEAAARAILSGEATPEQITMIATEAAFTGEAAPELCTKIVARADLFRSVVAAISGIRRSAIKQLDEAKAADFERILISARIIAQQAAAELGITIPD